MATTNGSAVRTDSTTSSLSSASPVPYEVHTSSHTETTTGADGVVRSTTTNTTTKRIHIVVNERTPLIRPGPTPSPQPPISVVGPSTLVDPEDPYPQFPKAVAGVPVDPAELEKLRTSNLVWKTICWTLIVVLHFIPPLYLLNLRDDWDDISDKILFGASKEWCRFFLLAAPWVATVLALLGWRYFAPPASKEQPAALPLTPWQWVDLRDGTADDPKLAETIVWWAEHPASLRQYAEFAVVSWLLWCVIACASAEALLICGFQFDLYEIPVWPWALIPFAFLASSSYVSQITQFFVSRGLKRNPVESRGHAEGILIPGLDIRAILAAERKRVDPCGSFPEPWAYFAGEIAIFLLML
ncbi:hypothetical protein DFJ73DRAFT_801592 [Zopfochytrium polystomum]|nr:hypothetical protein DFJ73DRAFT_801592 [Zopfochytrium polystomum]